MNKQLVVTNLENQMTEILRKMNEMSSTKGLINYNIQSSNMANETVTVDFSGYKSLVNVLCDVFETYVRLYRDSEDKKTMRNIVRVIQNKLDTELVLLNELSIIALKDTSEYKQYKCIMYCYNNIVRVLGKIEIDFKEPNLKMPQYKSNIISGVENEDEGEDTGKPIK